MRAIAADRRANASLMFAMFAAVLTLGILSLSKGVTHTMIAALNKQAAIRY
jgi:hypothetical protein